MLVLSHYRRVTLGAFWEDQISCRRAFSHFVCELRARHPDHNMPCRTTFARGPRRPGRRSRRGPARAAKRFSQASCNRIWAGLGFPFGASLGRLGSLFTDPETLVKQRRRMGNSQPNGPKYCLVRPNRKPTSPPPAVAPTVPTAVPTTVAPAVATARSSAARSATSRSSAAATRSAA